MAAIKKMMKTEANSIAYDSTFVKLDAIWECFLFAIFRAQFSHSNMMLVKGTRPIATVLVIGGGKQTFVWTGTKTQRNLRNLNYDNL